MWPEMSSVWREGEREGGREGGREGEREGGRERRRGAGHHGVHSQAYGGRPAASRPARSGEGGGDAIELCEAVGVDADTKGEGLLVSEGERVCGWREKEKEK